MPSPIWMATLSWITHDGPLKSQGNRVGVQRIAVEAD
jgi:hypothetical protein